MSVEEQIVLHVHHADGNEDILSIVLSDSIEVSDLKGYILNNYFQKKSYNIFTKIEIRDGDRVLDDSDLVQAHKLDIYISNGECPEGITLNNICDQMQNLFDISDPCQIAFSLKPKSLNKTLKKIVTSMLDDIVIINQANDENEEEEDNNSNHCELYKCNIPLSKILVRKKKSSNNNKSNQNIQPIKQIEKENSDTGQKATSYPVINEKLISNEIQQPVSQTVKEKPKVGKKKDADDWEKYEEQQKNEIKERDSRKQKIEKDSEEEQERIRKQCEEKLRKNKEETKPEDFKFRVLSIRYGNETKDIPLEIPSNLNREYFNYYMTEFLQIHQRFNLLTKVEPYDTTLRLDNNDTFSVVHCKYHICLFENRFLMKDELKAYIYLSIIASNYFQNTLREMGFKHPRYFIQLALAVFSWRDSYLYLSSNQDPKLASQKLFGLCLESLTKNEVQTKFNKDKLYNDLISSIEKEDTIFPLILYLIKNDYIQPIDGFLEGYKKNLYEDQKLEK